MFEHNNCFALLKGGTELTGHLSTTFNVTQSASTILQLQTTRVEEQFMSDEVQFTSDDPLDSDEPFNSDFISSAVRKMFNQFWFFL